MDNLVEEEASLIVDKNALRNDMREQDEIIGKGANWFFWIAGLSVINIFMAKSGGSFVVGLGINQVVNGLMLDDRMTSVMIQLAVSLLFVLFGYLGYKRDRVGLIIGTTIYLIDGLLYFISFSFLAIALHGYVIYRLVVAIMAAGKYNELRAKLGSSE